MRLRGAPLDEEVSRLTLLIRAALAPIAQVPLTFPVLNRAAGPFPTALGTLDAIHLASALIWTENRREDLTFLTHDRQLALGAMACGLEAGPAAL
jgi:hypothetical protein